MHPSQRSTESINEVIHRKKVPKKEQQATGQLPAEQPATGNWTTGTRVSQAVNPISPLLNDVESATDRTGSSQLDQSATGNKDRTRAQRINHDIDQFLFQLAREELINPAFQAWYAKAVRTLGLQQVNYIAINVRGTTACRDKSKLFSYKLKGALQSHYKAMFDAEGGDNQQR